MFISIKYFDWNLQNIYVLTYLAFKEYVYIKSIDNYFKNLKDLIRANWAKVWSKEFDLLKTSILQNSIINLAQILINYLFDDCKVTLIVREDW